MALRERIAAWLGVHDIRSDLHHFIGKEKIKNKIYNFWGVVSEEEEIRVLCGDEDVTHLFTKAEGIYQNGLFIFMLNVGTWDETKQGEISIVLPSIIQDRFGHGFNRFTIGGAFITSGPKANNDFQIPALVKTGIRQGNWVIRLTSPAYEHPAMKAQGDAFFDAQWKDVGVSSTRQDIPVNWHYIQEGGLIYGSIHLIDNLVYIK